MRRLLLHKTHYFFAIIFSLFTFFQSAQSQTIWDGITYDYSWYDADTNYFEISTASELAGLAALVNGTHGATQTSLRGKSIKLTADIWLNPDNYARATANNWEAIGGYGAIAEGWHASHCFAGYFDGGNHIIHNLHCDYGDDGYHAGLFGSVGTYTRTDTVYIRNLILRNVYVHAKSIGSAFVAYAYGGYPIRIENCLGINVEVNARNAGGIVSFALFFSPSDIIIENCAITQGNMHATNNAETGGLGGCLGETDGSKLINCYYQGTVSGGATEGGKIAGFRATLINCYAAAEGGGDGNDIEGSFIELDTNEMQLEHFFRNQLFITTFKNDCDNLNNGYPIPYDYPCSLPIDGATYICPGNSTTLTASGWDNYLWSNDSTTASITVTPSEKTTYFVTGTSGNKSATNAATVTVGNTISAVGRTSPMDKATFYFPNDSVGSYTQSCADQSPFDVLITMERKFYLTRLTVNGKTVATYNLEDRISSYTLTLNPTENRIWEITAHVSDKIYDLYTEECDIVKMPYFMDFNDTAFPDCWFRTGGGWGDFVQAPLYESSPESERKVVIINKRNTVIVATPRIAPIHSVSDIMLKLKMKANGVGRYIEVGIMADPKDETTFKHVATLNPLTMDWTDYVVYFSEYSDTGRFVAFRIPAESIGIKEIDDVFIDLIPDCIPAKNFKISEIGYSAANAQWETDNPKSIQTLEYAVTGSDEWTSLQVSGLSYIIPDLEPGISYTAKLTPCDSSATLTTQFTMPCNSDAIEKGTTSNSHLPIHFDYQYNYSQQIYTVEELFGVAKNITGLAFQIHSSSTNPTKNDISIYLGHTTQEGFINADEFVPGSDLTRVFNGTITLSKTGNPNWAQIDFDTTFFYNGIDNLVVAFFDSSGVSRGECRAYTHATPTTRSVYYYSNTTPLSVNPSATRNKETLKERNNMRFLPCMEPLNCTMPLDLTISEKSVDTLLVSWAAVNDSTLFELQYKPISAATWEVIDSISSRSQLITGTTARTSYYVRVRTICGEENVSAWITSTHTTSSDIICGKITQDKLPFKENFDSYNTGDFPMCWNRTTTDAQICHTYNSYPSSLHLAAYSTVVTPEFDMPLNTLEVRFKLEGYSDIEPFIIGVITDPANSNTFVPVDTHYISLPNTFEEVEISLQNYTGNARYIAFKNKRIQFCLDDLEISGIATCNRPKNVILNQVDDHSATLTWENNNNSTTWELVYGYSGFDPDTAATIGVQGNSVYAITNLEAATKYDVYIRTICDSNDVSAWSRVFPLQTECAEITTFPHLEDFNSPDYAFPACWTMVGAYSPIIEMPNITPTSSALCLNAFYSLFTYAATPPINTPLRNLWVNFKANTYISGSIIVGVMSVPSDINSFVPIDTLHIQSQSFNQWAEYEVYFHNYSGSAKHIVFMSTDYSDIYIDDVTIDFLTSCPKPMNLTATDATQKSVTLDWHYLNENEWKIEVGPKGFTPGIGNGSIHHVTTVPPFTVTGLSKNREYDFYVQAICNVGDTSKWSDKTSMKTPCLTIDELPYSENFDSYTTSGIEDRSVIPDCWRTSSLYGTGPYIANWGPSFTYNNSPYALDFNHSRYGYSLAILPPIDDSISLDEILLSFFGKGMGLIIGVMTDPTDDDTFIPVDTAHGHLAGFYPKAVDFSSYNGTGKYIAFKWADKADSYFLDNLIIDYRENSPCPTPENFTVRNIEPYSATIHWTMYGFEDSWIFKYRKARDTDFITRRIYQPSDTLTNLEAGTEYEICVSADCDFDATFMMSSTTSMTFITAKETTYVINASADENGSISPSGNIIAYEGGSITFYFTPDDGYIVGDVFVNGFMVGNGLESYDLTDIRENQIVIATFIPKDTITFTITSQAGENGKITPSGIISIVKGESKTFHIQPDNNYIIRLVEVDGAEIEIENNQYTFQDVQDNASIYVEFEYFFDDAIANFNTKNSVHIFPNPSENILHVQSEKIFKTIEIVNIFGQITYSLVVNEKDFSIDISKFAGGVYFIKLINEEGVTVKKFVKQ
ncbi:T9SS type A sorting domain-containing protein [Bacteroidales bacterium OttesenSCG-928-B11]|nr:T9SS type A sorting domain-containing protein [Bacteroidales bacterium OttesenSCG-928-E04]MDL2313039.1 T9SS type A sorting domain-containing protein [Bacteroidales bacterium OttesenSCG-928-B11]